MRASTLIAMTMRTDKIVYPPRSSVEDRQSCLSGGAKDLRLRNRRSCAICAASNDMPESDRLKSVLHSAAWRTDTPVCPLVSSLSASTPASLDGQDDLARQRVEAS